MPSIKAEDLQVGHVLLDPAGHLYEIQAVLNTGAEVFVWLWPDSSRMPNQFQAFELGEEVDFISQAVNDGTLPDGAAE